jgi:hypothetical protein
VTSNEQQPRSPNQPNVLPDQVHLVLNFDELATIVTALHACGLHAFAERLDIVRRQIAPELPVKSRN